MSTSSLHELKCRIYDEGRVGKLLEELNCDTIQLKSGRSSDDLVTARLPDSTNKRSVQVYLSPYLNSEIVNRGISGDIYSVAGYLLYNCQSFEEVKSHLYQIKTFICNALGYDDLLNQPFVKPETKIDWNWWLRPIQKERVREIEVVENPILDEIVLNEFVTNPWGKWYIEEGISLETQKLFGIGFHVLSERITIPIHNKYGQLIGVKGRLSYESETLPKYSYIYPCSKSIELYNLHRSLPYIKEKKEVLIVEGAKTTMKLWDCGIRNTVSIEGDKLNPVQVKLLKELGLETDYVFAWDKGKDEEFVKKQLKQIKNRRVFYLFDNADRFEDKDSPTDKGMETFLDLYNNDKHEYK